MKNNMKKFLSMLLAVLMMASLNVTVFAAEGDFTADTMTGGNDFNYVVVTKDVYTDISGVKLTWSVPVVKYTKTDTRTWNTETLHWEQTNPVSTEGNEVSFTLTNRGSYAVKANVSFTPVIADSASVDFGSTNDPTLATIVNADHTLQVAQGDMSDEAYATAKTKYVADNCSATISGTVSIEADKLSADTGKLGTYTVSIRNTVHTVTIKYCETEDDTKLTTKTISVADGTEVTFTGNALTIDGTTYTDYFTGTAWVYYLGDDVYNADILVSGSTVTADMTIRAAR